jgi:ribosomal protein S1
MIEDYIGDTNELVVSNKKYLQFELPKRINDLMNGDRKRGLVTGIAKFGIFLEFDDVFTGLLHVSEMGEEILDDFYNGVYHPGSEIEFYIKDINKNNRIILTDKMENIVYFNFEDLQNKYEGETVQGVVTAIRPDLGIFVKLDIPERDDISGLIFRTYIYGYNYVIGDTINVKISQVDTIKENIKLVPVSI